MGETERRPNLNDEPFGFKVRRIALPGLSDAEIRSWHDLAGRSSEANAYASPSFMLPMLRHIETRPVSLIIVERSTSQGASQWVGALPIQRVLGRKSFPLPHAAAYCGLYSFLGAPLIDEQCGQACWSALLQELSRSRLISALQIELMARDGRLHRDLQAACEQRGLILRDGLSRQRSVLERNDMGADGLRRHLRKAYAAIERRRRKLGELGQLEWRLLRGNQISDTVVDDFLRLEHDGWKGEAGTALRSKPQHEAFFRELVERFNADHEIFFTEVRLDGATIASTANFISGSSGFAFKTGWAAAYRQHGIGILNEFELVRGLPDHLPELLTVDSGAEPGTYIDKLYPGRRELITATVCFNRAALWTLDVMGWLRSKRSPAVQTRSDSGE